MKTLLNVFAVVALVAFTSTAIAQEEGEKCAAKECPAQTSTVAAQADDKKAGCQQAGCPVSAAMAKLPKMTYTVGEEATCCADSAKALAEKTETPIKFVVGEKSFDDKKAAYTSLVEQTETFVNAFITPSKCEASGTHTVAGVSCKCPVEAGQKAELVKAATEKIQMTYVVGKESCHCPTTASKMAEKAGEKVSFKVGEEATSCEITARINLAHAKYKAAVQALIAKAEKPAEEKTETSGT
jgi:hypothetical protein